MEDTVRMRTTYIFCYISEQPLIPIRPDFICRLYLKHLTKCAQILIADSLPIIYDVFVALRAYHLTCHSDKFRSSYYLFFILLSFFQNLLKPLQSVFIIQSSWKLSWSLTFIWSCIYQFFMKISHAWRHVGAILFFSHWVT